MKKLPMTHEQFNGNNAVRFIGSDGRIDVRRRNFQPTPINLWDKIITDDQEQVYRSENHYKDWLNAIRNRSTPICDAETGHRTNSVCLLGNIAYELKRPLQWDPVKEQFAGDSEADRLLGRELRAEWAIPM